MLLVIASYLQLCTVMLDSEGSVEKFVSRFMIFKDSFIFCKAENERDESTLLVTKTEQVNRWLQTRTLD